MTGTAVIPIVPYEARFGRGCERLLASIPEWFGIPESNAMYLRDLGRLPSWVGVRGDTILGAATLATHTPTSLEIHFLRLARQGPIRATSRTVGRLDAARIVRVELHDEGADEALTTLGSVVVERIDP